MIRDTISTNWLKFRLWFGRRLPTILMTFIAILVGLIFLIIIVQASNARKEVEAHRKQAEETLQQLKDIANDAKREATENAKRDEQVHNEIKDFLCELVRLAPEGRVTPEQLALCEGYPPPEGEDYPKPVTYGATPRIYRLPATSLPRAPLPAPRTPGNSPPPPPTSQREQPKEPQKLENPLPQTSLEPQTPLETLVGRIQRGHGRGRKL